jgi:LacI family transcriptional regulator
VAEMARNAPALRGIYLLGSGHRALAQVLEDLRLTHRVTMVGHELTPHARAALGAGTMDAVITQNVGHLVRSALRVLRAKTDRMPIDPGQEQIRIEIVIRENLPAIPEGTGREEAQLREPEFEREAT